MAYDRVNLAAYTATGMRPPFVSINLEPNGEITISVRNPGADIPSSIVVDRETMVDLATSVLTKLGER